MIYSFNKRYTLTMKTLTLFLSIVITVSAVSDFEEWLSFKNKYSKIYKSVREESYRFEIFRDNLRKMEGHNDKYEIGEESYKLGVNQFTDLTQEEFVQKWSLPKFLLEKRTARFSVEPDLDPAPSVDWRVKGAVFDVGTQGNCSSDWAFSAVGALEGQNAIKHSQKIQLSPQELIDCSRHYGTYGCGGGWVNYAFKYVRDNGISSLKDYPYKFQQERCKNWTKPRVNLKVTGYTLVDPTEEALRQAVEKVGPISVFIDGEYIATYEKGIFQHENCTTNTPNQALLAVGYGTENGTDYWILKNSYGNKWGENGYIRMIRNKNNTCGVATYAMYPNIP